MLLDSTCMINMHVATVKDMETLLKICFEDTIHLNLMILKFLSLSTQPLFLNLSSLNTLFTKMTSH